MKGVVMLLKLVLGFVMFALPAAGCGSPKAEKAAQAPSNPEEPSRSVAMQADDAPPAAPPPAEAPPQAQPENPEPQAGIGDLLDQLERSAADLHAFIAKVTYDRRDELVGKTETRTGELIYQFNPETKQKKFAILFDSLLVGNRLREERKHFIFDGRWLAEIDAKEKQFIKREIVPPG